MASVDELADARQSRLVAVSTAATNRGLALWRRMDFRDLDTSWREIERPLTVKVESAQMEMVRGADRFTARASSAVDFDAEPSRVVPEAFAGVDGSGRGNSSLLLGAVTTTKEAVGAGLSAPQALEAGAAYLAAMMKTAIADVARSADMVSAAGKGFTRYARVVEPGACSRCVVLAGATQFKPFKRHPACKCTVQPIPADEYLGNPRYSPNGVFDSMSEADQNRAFGKAGAQAIRDGADVGQVVSARRGANGIGYASRGHTEAGWKRMQKTTIGYRPDGSPVRVYTTTEGTTSRGQFGRAQRDRTAFERRAGARYTSTKRVRLMPEEIMNIAGDDKALRQAFLRDAGYLEYMPKNGFDNGNRWIGELEEMRVADRKLVDRATLKYGNFTLG
jgi:hypothetical protein